MSTDHKNKNPFSRFKELMGRNLENKYLEIAGGCVMLITGFRLPGFLRQCKIQAIAKTLGIEGFAESCVIIIFCAAVICTEQAIIALIDEKISKRRRNR